MADHAETTLPRCPWRHLDVWCLHRMNHGAESVMLPGEGEAAREMPLTNADVLAHCAKTGRRPADVLCRTVQGLDCPIERETPGYDSLRHMLLLGGALRRFLPAAENQGGPLDRLVARLKSREPAAWGHLLRKFAPFLYAAARRSGLKCEDAEDSVQDVFLAILGHVAGWDEKMPDGDFLAWLRAVAANKVRDHFRGHQVEPEAVGGNLAQELLAQVRGRAPADGSATDRGDSDERALQREAVRRGLTQVEEKTRQAFLRHAVDERPAKEVVLTFPIYTVEALH